MFCKQNIFKYKRKEFVKNVLKQKNVEFQTQEQMFTCKTVKRDNTFANKMFSTTNIILLTKCFQTKKKYLKKLSI